MFRKVVKSVYDEFTKLEKAMLRRMSNIKRRTGEDFVEHGAPVVPAKVLVEVKLDEVEVLEGARSASTGMTLVLLHVRDQVRDIIDRSIGLRAARVLEGLQTKTAAVEREALELGVRRMGT